MSESGVASKLVGSQYLQLDQLKSDVSKANDLLSSIGKGIDLDFTKQIKASFDSALKEVKAKVKEIQVVTSSAATTPAGMSGAFDTLKIKQYADQYGNLSKTIVEGMDSAGNKIRQTVKDGELFSTVIEQTGEEAKLWAQIEQEQKKAREEERQIMKDLIAEQNEYIAAQERINKAQQEMSRRGKERDYELLFDEIDQKGQEQYLSSLDRQIQLTKELYSTEVKLASTSSKKEQSAYAEQAESIRAQLKAESQISSELARQSGFISNNEIASRKLKELADERKKGEEQVRDALKEQEQGLNKLSSVQDQVVRSLTHMIVMYASKALSDFWKNGWEYAQKYYDLLNEIQIVTGATEAEAATMGKTYRQMAKDMKVSSTDIASAAVEFWRQGLDSSEVDSRLVNTTQYAKISGLNFTDAAEQVTAATNSMELDSQRVVDVFSYLGDASASG